MGTLAQQQPAHQRCRRRCWQQRRSALPRRRHCAEEQCGSMGPERAWCAPRADAGLPRGFPAQHRPAAWFWLLRTIRTGLLPVRAALHAAAIVFWPSARRLPLGSTPAAGLSHPSIKFVMIHSYHRSSRKASHDRRRDRHVTAACAVRRGGAARSLAPFPIAQDQ